MSEEGKELVRRWVEAWNTNTNFEVIDQIFARDWIDMNPIPGAPAGGIEGATYFVRAFRNSFDDISFAVELLLGEGDWVVFRWRAEATHANDFLGIAATGKRVSFTGVTGHRVANHRFAESFAEIDLLGLTEQLRG